MAEASERKQIDLGPLHAVALTVGLALGGGAGTALGPREDPALRRDVTELVEQGKETAKALTGLVARLDVMASRQITESAAAAEAKGERQRIAAEVSAIRERVSLLEARGGSK